MGPCEASFDQPLLYEVRLLPSHSLWRPGLQLVLSVSLNMGPCEASFDQPLLYEVSLLSACVQRLS